MTQIFNLVKILVAKVSHYTVAHGCSMQPLCVPNCLEIDIFTNPIVCPKPVFQPDRGKNAFGVSSRRCVSYWWKCNERCGSIYVDIHTNVLSLCHPTRNHRSKAKTSTRARPITNIGCKDMCSQTFSQTIHSRYREQFDILKHIVWGLFPIKGGCHHMFGSTSK